MLTFLVITYLVIAIALSILFGMLLVEETRKNGQSARARNLASRLLLSLVWPLLIPMGILFVIRIAIGKGHR